MTAIAMWVGPSEIAVASDGVAYDYGGTVRQIHAKQIVDLAWGAVVTASGSGGVLDYLRVYIAAIIDPPPFGFDEFLRVLPDAGRWIMQQIADRRLVGDVDGSSPPGFQMLIGGVSDERQRYEGYWFGSVSFESEGKTIEAFTPVPVQAFAKPEASEEALKEVGLWPIPATIDDPLNFAIGLMDAQRRTPMLLHNQVDGPRGYGVGGFCQITKFRKDLVTTFFAKRWPDKIGEKIDPTSGYSFTSYPDLLADEGEDEKVG